MTGESDTGELAAAKNEKSHLFLSPSLLPAFGINRKNMLALVFIESKGNLFLLAKSAER